MHNVNIDRATLSNLDSDHAIFQLFALFSCDYCDLTSLTIGGTVYTGETWENKDGSHGVMVTRKNRGKTDWIRALIRDDRVLNVMSKTDPTEEEGRGSIDIKYGPCLWILESRLPE
jgi:hypothetical protein